MLETNDTELLSAYIDGEVSADEFNRVNALLAASADHRQELERLNGIKASLASAPRMTAPADLVAALLSHPAMARHSERKSWFRSLFPETPRWAIAGSMGFAASVFAAWAVISAPWAPQPLPLQPLVAAHARSVGMGGDIHASLVAASTYSSQLATDNAATN